MFRLHLFKALSYSLLALSVVSNLPSFGGKLTKEFDEAQTSHDKRSLATQAIKKIEDQLIKENNKNRVTKLETMLKRWKERLEDIERKETISHGGQSSEVSSFGRNVDQQLPHIVREVIMLENRDVLTHGKFGYKKDPKAAITLIGELMAKGRP